MVKGEEMAKKKKTAMAKKKYTIRPKVYRDFFNAVEEIVQGNGKIRKEVKDEFIEMWPLSDDGKCNQCNVEWVQNFVNITGETSVNVVMKWVTYADDQFPSREVALLYNSYNNRTDPKSFFEMVTERNNSKVTNDSPLIDKVMVGWRFHAIFQFLNIDDLKVLVNNAYNDKKITNPTYSGLLTYNDLYNEYHKSIPPSNS